MLFEVNFYIKEQRTKLFFLRLTHTVFLHEAGLMGVLPLTSVGWLWKTREDYKEKKWRKHNTYKFGLSQGINTKVILTIKVPIYWVKQTPVTPVISDTNNHLTLVFLDGEHVLTTFSFPYSPTANTGVCFFVFETC